MHEQWQCDKDTACSSLTHTIGGLALTTTLAVYLSSLLPHAQLDILHCQLRPVLEERGIELHWKAADSFLITHSNTEHNTKPSPQEDKTDQSEDSNKALPHSPVVPTQATPTYTNLCISLLPHLVSESFVDHWLVEGYQPVQLLPVALVSSSWNRWPLVYDPEGFARTWVKQFTGEELVTLDATDR